MAKIKDLTNDQLKSQLDKYTKIYHQLIKERQSRIDKGTDEEELLTDTEKRERAEKFKEFEAAKLDFEEEELEQLQNTNYKKIEEKQKEKQEEVSVTQLLNLTKEQQEELNMPSEDNSDTDPNKKKD